jgi:hypothetical protein
VRDSGTVRPDSSTVRQFSSTVKLDSGTAQPYERTVVRDSRTVERYADTVEQFWRTAQRYSSPVEPFRSACEVEAGRVERLGGPVREARPRVEVSEPRDFNESGRWGRDAPGRDHETTECTQSGRLKAPTAMPAPPCAKPDPGRGAAAGPARRADRSGRCR